LLQAPGMKLLASIAVSAALFASACAADSDAELFDLDSQAAAQEGKADSPTNFTRLDRATPAEIATHFTERHAPELIACFARFQELYPGENVTELTADIAVRFIDVSLRSPNGECLNWQQLKETVWGVLLDQNRTSMPVDDVVAGIPAWVESKLASSSASGFVNIERAPSTFYYEILDVQNANARSRERDPSGVDLELVREDWSAINQYVTHDVAYLNPVTFPAGVLDGSQIFTYLRAAFPLRSLSLVSTRTAAIDDFASSYQGPDGTPEWDEIATLLGKRSIKKRFYFAGGGDEWTSNVLIVVDEHGQAWGFQMGYSE
jgi:hypothetical protein